MSANIFTKEAAAKANIQTVGSETAKKHVHPVIEGSMPNRRTGSACAKTRGEVSGSNKKIFRQKGTGNARHGDKRAPIMVGGGVVFGPRPRDYSKKVNKNTRRLALRRVLGDLIEAGTIKTVSAFSVEDGKTKSFISAVNALTDAKKGILVVSGSFDENTYRSARNVQEVLLITAAEVNIEQLMNANAVILVESALETLAARTA